MPGANKSNPRVTSAKKIGKLRQSFQFLLAKEETAAVFMISVLASATGWKKGTISTYLGKKWNPFVHRALAGAGYRVQGIGSYTEDEYTRLMSQRDEVSADPNGGAGVPSGEFSPVVRSLRKTDSLDSIDGGAWTKGQ